MFVELAARTAFSFLRGASQPEEMVEQAHAIGLAAMAVCDRDGLYGTARAYAKAKEIGQKIHLGAEVPLALSEEELRAGHGGLCHGGLCHGGLCHGGLCHGGLCHGGLCHGGIGSSDWSELQCRQLLREAKPNVLRKRLLSEDGYPSVILLAKTREGYQNLCWLLTRAHSDLAKGECLLSVDDLDGHVQGLIALVPTQMLELRAAPGHCSSGAPTRDIVPERILARLSELFGAEAIHTVIHRRLSRDDAARTLLAKYRERRYGLPILASARPLYHCKSRKRLADVVQCIRLGTTLGEAKTRLSSNGQEYLRNTSQMLRLFSDQPDWVERTAEVSGELRFSLEELKYHFPCRTPPNVTPDEHLKEMSWQGARRRYPGGIPEKVVRQIESELGLIQRMGMAPYFLSTWDVVEIARERGILCQGRGSAANSAVCYALGITAVNPERSNLLFERFMSEERKEPPDIDVDFEHERREEVIQEIYRRYGRDRAAMVSEVICYRRKSALREVAKVFGFSLDQVDRLVGAFSHWDTFSHSDSGGSDTGGNSASLKERLRASGLDDNARQVKGVLELARELSGFPRHLSIHVGGFVLSARPLSEVSPVEPARMEDRSVVPWDKDDLDTLGFFKIDVLGLGMLTAIRKALQLVWENDELRSDPAELFDPLEVITRVPDEDAAVYALASRADTVGVFQIESRAQMAMLPRLRPQCFYDLVIEVAIVRPGPIQGGMVHPYLRRRNHEEAPHCHPLLENILRRTLGVPLFQEQVMQIAITGAGYSGGEADQLRRDMAAWKKAGRLLRHRQRLLDGFAKNGIGRDFGEALFEQIKGFGEYGFPESHAASFALLVYKSAWLKAHYPAHFVCALLNSQPMGFYSASSLVRDAQKHGVEVHPVCVVGSEWDCTLEKGEASKQAVRLGLRMIKGLAKASAERLIQRREQLRETGMTFESFFDLARQVPLPKGDVEALAEAGAFKVLEAERRQALWSARAPRQMGLFHDAQLWEPRAELPRLKPIEVLALDYGRVRLSIDDHPLCHLRSELRRKAVLTTEELASCQTGQRVAVAGLVTARQRPGTASGVVFVTLEDETGVANLVFYSRVFEKYRYAAHSPLLLVRGKVERQDPPPGSVDLNDPRQARGVAPIVHLIVELAERLNMPGPSLSHKSRDFR